MITFRELLKTSTYWTTLIQADLYAAVESYMEKHALTRVALAKQLGVTKGYITQVLNGDFDHRISKLVEIALAVGKAPVISFEDIDGVIQAEELGLERNISYHKPLMFVKASEIAVESIPDEGLATFHISMEGASISFFDLNDTSYAAG